MSIFNIICLVIISWDFCPSYTIKVNFAKKGIISINDLQNLSSIRHLDLQSKSISYISDSAFYWSRNLTILNLSRNKLSFLTNRTFLGLDKLEKLDLRFNDLSSVSRVFSPLNSLLELYIDKNKFQIIKSDFFIGLEQLKKLYIRNNYITEIEDFSFLPLKNLHTFNLWGSLMRVYTKNAFKGLFKVTHFFLGNTKLRKIEKGAFSDLVRLGFLYGPYTDLETFSKNVFNSSNLPTQVSFWFTLTTLTNNYLIILEPDRLYSTITWIL